MNRVLEECDRAGADFAADPVHDLRVALRRCRSIADGMIAMDPDPAWKAMKKAGKELFRKLGELRDTHVMMDWVNQLNPTHTAEALNSYQQIANAETSPVQQELAQTTEGSDPVAKALLEILASREDEQKRAAREALDDFDRKQWRQWTKILPRRAARVRPGSVLFKHLALERWTEARELHRRALRSRSQAAMHSLRIGIKRFRYIVENFLPKQHAAWSGDLKKLQDILGEVHDLDVLWATALFSHVFRSLEDRRRWHSRILAERTERIELYREKMTGPNSLWPVWRAALPQGRQLQAIATRRMKLWAKGLDPDFAHSQRVAAFAMQLLDGLTAAGMMPTTNGIDTRSTLFAAGLLHDVGKAKKNGGHHKKSFKLIQSHATPLGWRAEDLRRAAIVARYHRGALPARRHKALHDLPAAERKVTVQLAAILRLANALDASHDGRIRQVRVERDTDSSVNRNGLAGKLSAQASANGHLGKAKQSAITIAAEGYSAFSPNAQAVAAERHLLETVLRRPVIVKPMKSVPKLQRGRPSVKLAARRRG